jgi:hypothetical protein
MAETFVAICHLPSAIRHPPSGVKYGTTPMRIPETAEFAVESERSSIRWFYIYAAGLVTIGVAVLVITFMFPSIAPGGDAMKPIIAIAGTFIGSMGGFPLKEIIAREQRVRYLRWLKTEAAQPNADLPQLESLLLDFVKKGTA